MKHLMIAALVLSPTLALADENLDWQEATGSVQEAADRLQSVVEEAGATVYARIDHGKAGEAAGIGLAESQLLIFGAPSTGARVMQENFRAGLVMPLRVLVVRDDGRTWYVSQDVKRMMDSVNVDQEIEDLTMIDKMLTDLTTKAAAVD